MKDYRWSRIKNKLLNHRYGTIILVYLIFYLQAFSYLEGRNNIEFHVIYFPVDDLIPFLEVFIIPYMLWFPFVALTVVWFIFHKGAKDEYYRLAANLILGMSIFLLVSWLYPNMLELRPQVFPRDNLLTDAVRWLYRTDTPTNVLPSIHVFNSLACDIAIKTSRDLKEKTLVQVLSTSMTVLVILSTMFLKQHSIVDVSLGSAMALLGYTLLYNPSATAEKAAGRRLAYANTGRIPRKN